MLPSKLGQGNMMVDIKHLCPHPKKMNGSLFVDCIMIYGLFFIQMARGEQSVSLFEVDCYVALK